MTTQALGALEGNCVFLCGEEKCFSELLNLLLSLSISRKAFQKQQQIIKFTASLLSRSVKSGEGWWIAFMSLHKHVLCSH